MGLWNLLPEQWQVALLDIMPNVERISHELDLQNTRGSQVTPDTENVFAALPDRPGSVKVVIIGQDPYPTPGHATGSAFSVPAGTRPLPPTLRNILRELHDDIPDSTATQDELSNWRDQGVLLLNRILTTEAGSSLAHQHLGWQEVTLEIVKAVRRANEDVVGVLWGKYAQALADEFEATRVVTSVHPSPLSAYRGFFGSKPFSKVNDLLVEAGQEPIHW